MVADHILEQIRSQIEPVLKARGVRRRGPMWHCPFHDDRNPSASIKTGSFHCFGCDIHLDPIAFVMEYHAIGFNAAVELLCHELAIPLEAQNRVISIEQHRRVTSEAEQFVLWR